jgi:long-chain-fatty-acid--[acyl-carrier-protein] ligase
MLNRFLRLLIRSLLWLRYRIRVRGMDRVAPPDGRGVLFLANHPALIDPIIVMTVLWSRFRPRVLADRAQARRWGIHFLARRARALEIADMTRDGRGAREQVESMIEASAAALRRGEALLLYPAGRIYRQRREDLGGNSAVEQLLQAVPDVRVVLVRTAGLWGSSFSRASGKPPEVMTALRRGLWGLLKCGIFLSPRRHVAIDVVEPDDLPRTADRVVLNRYLEDFYNSNAGGSTYVPHSLWEGGGVRWLPEPVSSAEPGVARRIPPATRDTVLEYLRKLTGVRDINESQRLAHDLGLDSLVRVEIQAWIESEFGFPQPEVDGMETVGDVMRAAVGETVGKAAAEPQPVAHAWTAAAQDATMSPVMPAGDSLTAVFLDMARRHPSQVVIADQQSGVRSYRDLVTALLLLRPVFARMPGSYVGIMLPASVAASVATLAARRDARIGSARHPLCGDGPSLDQPSRIRRFRRHAGIHAAAHLPRRCRQAVLASRQAARGVVRATGNHRCAGRGAGARSGCRAFYQRIRERAQGGSSDSGQSARQHPRRTRGDSAAARRGSPWHPAPVPFLRAYRRHAVAADVRFAHCLSRQPK